VPYDFAQLTLAIDRFDECALGPTNRI
jgi:hypothetical protein